MRKMAALAEEKKEDDGDYNHVVRDDEPQSIINETKFSPETNESKDLTTHDIDSQKAAAPAPQKTKKSPLLLLVCASGITSCYLWYGTIQEHIFHMDNNASDDKEGEGGDKQSITLFLLATGTFSAFLIAWIWSILGPILLSMDKSSGSSTEGKRDTKEQTEGRLNHPLIILTSITYLSAMSASNESLHYVSYPTCVLAKSSKLIPTMLVGWLVDQWRNWRRSRGSNSSSSGTNANDGHGKSINTLEWIGAALITLGILLFQYIQLQKQSSENHHGSHGGTNEDKGDSPFGLALLGLSLFMDGLLGACQSVLKQKGEAPPKDSTNNNNNNIAVQYYRPPTAMETMLYINLYATFILLAASHYAGQFQRGIDMMLTNSNTKSMLLLQLNLSASLGQVFIFLTIHYFSPLTCTTITTTRKFFTLLLSVYKFGHVLNVWQWVSVGLVFGGLYLQIAAKLFEQQQQHHPHDEATGEGKKKVE